MIVLFYEVAVEIILIISANKFDVLSNIQLKRMERGLDGRHDIKT